MKYAVGERFTDMYDVYRKCKSAQLYISSAAYLTLVLYHSKNVGDLFIITSV